MEMTKKAYVIQERGQITLPAGLRRKYGLKKGDIVVFEETVDGILISPRETLVMRLLDDIGGELKQRGVTLEDLIEGGREIRGELLKKLYGIEPEDD
jgi:AbrB family looped-hinge helix DNA binding protein